MSVELDEDGRDQNAEDSIRVIRKYRKKLRQIERLEASGRELTEDEQEKLNAKAYIRSKLQEVLLNQSNKEEYLEDQVQDENSEEDDSHLNVGDNEIESEENYPEFNETQYQPARENLEATRLAQNLEIIAEDKDIPTISPPAKTVVIGDQISLEKPTYIPNLGKDISGESGDGVDIKSKYEINAEVQRKAKEKRHKQRTKLRKLWRNKVFKVSYLEGHNESVCDVDVYNDWLVSGSRDTSVKLWKISTLSEIRNMAGHTGSVTGVKLINEQDTERLREMIKGEVSELMHDISTKEFDREQFLITVSIDCYIKLWLLPQGLCIKSIYNYSPISSMFYFHNYVFVGSETGKLTGYNLITGQNVYEELIHTDLISSLQGNVSEIVSTSLDGNLKLFEVYDNDKRSVLDKIKGSVNLNLVYSYRDTDSFVEGRQVLSSCINKDKIYFGDDGVNLKVLDKSEGLITRHPNHKAGSSGFTDDVIVFNNFLFMSSYDLDSGEGSINLRVINGESPMVYIATLGHSQIPRITCLGVDCFAPKHTFVTGGSKLLVWIESQNQDFKNSTSLDVEGKIHFKGKTTSDIGKHAAPSDVESDSGEETEEGGWHFWKKMPTTPTKKVKRESDSDSDDSESSNKDQDTSYNGWSSWCSLL